MLDLLHVEEILFLVAKRLGDIAQVAAQAAQPVRLQAGGMVRALPGAVQGEVALDIGRYITTTKW